MIPADERSGSATDALVPEFIDFILDDPLAEPRERESLQTRVRGGLAWLDRECRGRFSKAFVDCAGGERTAVLDDIAWPEKARPEMEPGAAFFTLFRDLVASGFWSSRIGRRGPALHGQHVRGRVEGLPARGAGEDRARGRKGGRVTTGRSFVLAALVALAGLAVCAPGRASARSAESSGAPAEVTVNSIGMKLVRIPAGEFDMGSPASEPGHVANEGPVHRVRITRAFEMGVHEVTNVQFRAFAEGTAYETEAQLDVEGGFGIDFERAVVDPGPAHRLAQPRLPGLPAGARPPGAAGQLARRRGLLQVALREGGADVPPADGGRVGVRGASGDEDALVDGRRPGGAGDAPATRRTRRSGRRCRGRSGQRPGTTATRSWRRSGRSRPTPSAFTTCTATSGSGASTGTGPTPTRSRRWTTRRGPPTGSFRTIRGGGWWNDARQNRSAQRIYFKPTFRYCLLSGFRVVRELP